MLFVIIITGILTTLCCWIYFTLKHADTCGELMEAVRLLELQRYRVQYKMDDQLATQRQVAEFIARHK